MGNISIKGRRSTSIQTAIMLALTIVSMSIIILLGLEGVLRGQYFEFVEADDSEHGRLSV